MKKKRMKRKKKRKKRNRSLSSVRVSVKQLAGDSTTLQYCVDKRQQTIGQIRVYSISCKKNRIKNKAKGKRKGIHRVKSNGHTATVVPLL